MVRRGCAQAPAHDARAPLAALSCCQLFCRGRAPCVGFGGIQNGLVVAMTESLLPRRG